MNNVFIKKEELNEWLRKYFKGDLISIDDMISVMEDLDSEIDRLKEKIEDIEQDKEDNYRPLHSSELYGVSERDFH